jgi:hypothetical protein
VQVSMMGDTFGLKKEVHTDLPCQGRQSRSSRPLTTVPMI